MVRPHSPSLECLRPQHLPLGSKTDFGQHRLPVVVATNSNPEIDSNAEKEEPWIKYSKSHSATKVKFSRVVKVKRIVPIPNISERMVEKYWISPKELAQIRSDCRDIVLKMMAGDVIDNDEEGYCTRGLECRTKQGQQDRKRAKSDVRKAVILQQQFQREEGMVDNDFMAVLSSSKTKDSAIAAFKAAQRDAEEVKRIYR